MSPASLETWVIGGLFSFFSASTRAVLSTSLETTLSARIAFSVFLVHCTSLSHTPAKCGPLGGWNFYSISLGAQKFCILYSSNCLIHFCNSLFAPTKLVPLSLRMLWGRPRRAMNLFIATLGASRASWKIYCDDHASLSLCAPDVVRIMHNRGRRPWVLESARTHDMGQFFHF